MNKLHCARKRFEKGADEFHRLFLLARLVLVVNQLAHHLPAAGEFLGGLVEVVGDARAVGNLEVGKPVAAFLREGLRIEGKGS